MAGTKECLGLWVAYPLIDEPHKYTWCPAHKVEMGTLSDGGNFGAEMSFSASSARPCTQLAKKRAGGYMRISASIHDVVEQRRNLCKIPRMYHVGDRRQKHTGSGWVHTGNAMPYNRNIE
jgi:hypothetical protein